MEYKQKNIQDALTMLNNLEIKGIDNCKRVAMIASILSNPEKGEEKNENSV